MADDEINDVRKVRRRISAEHDHDADRLVAHYQAFEKELRAAGRFRFVGDVTESNKSSQNEERQITSG